MEAEELKEVVGQMLQAKLNLPADEQYLLQDKRILESAIAYYSKFGDFSVQYDPGDGADGFDLTHIGGNVNPFLIVGPPALQSSDIASGLDSLQLETAEYYDQHSFAADFEGPAADRSANTGKA